MSRQGSKKLPKQITLRGRLFTAHEIVIIRRLVKSNFSKGRTHISKTICEALNWKQPNGWPKDRACRDVLVQLEQMGVITLPKPKVKKGKSTRSKLDDVTTRITHPTISQPKIMTYPHEISLKLAKGNTAEQQWNYLVNTYHYLGHKVIVGRCLKYLINADGYLVAAISFSSSAWHLAERDRILKQLINQEQIHDLVINNSRFLILPNVQVPNLASTILAVATKQVVKDWSDYYAITPQFVETFVEVDRFWGTCYKAANWLEIGLTQGFAKSGSSYHNGQPQKQVFLYALNRGLRKKLNAIVHSVGGEGE